MINMGRIFRKNQFVELAAIPSVAKQFYSAVHGCSEKNSENGALTEPSNGVSSAVALGLAAGQPDRVKTQHRQFTEYLDGYSRQRDRLAEPFAQIVQPNPCVDLVDRRVLP